MNLQSLQDYFQAYLIDHDLNTIKNHTVENQLLNVAKRLQIYYDGYRLRLLEVLADDYPKLHTFMGDEKFHALAYEYIETYPSQHFSARYFGQYLAQYLNKNPTTLYPQYLAEMATFEWLMSDTLDAPDAPTLSLNSLQTIAPEHWGYLQIQFHPSLRLLDCVWDTPQLWLAIENDEAPRMPEKLASPVTWILWRSNLQCQFRSLDPSQTLILKMFQQNHTFSDICEALSEIIKEESVPAIALGFIQECLMDDLVSHINIVSDS